MTDPVQSPSQTQAYRGRFAPSPTGPLHLGSLVAAVASYLEAAAATGQWWLRIEDIDPPREVPGAADAILFTLEAFGFTWDALVYQHERREAYAAALAELKARDLLYACTCSRKMRAETQDTRVYPGTCRDRSASDTPAAWRIRTQNAQISFTDAVQGPIHCDLNRDCGDFILRRADGYFSYQLAVAFDDATQGITSVVRGSDLLDSTPRQLYVQRCLGLTPPRYAHVPVLVNAQGQKLSKQTRAPALRRDDPSPQLWQALFALGQTPPTALQHADLATLWEWAKQHWNQTRIPRQRTCDSDKVIAAVTPTGRAPANTMR